MDAEVVVVDVAGPEAPSPGEAAGARAEPSDGKGAMLPYLLVYDIF